MIKKYFIYTFALLAFVLSSCVQEEFTDDISLYKDYFIEVVALTDPLSYGESASYHVTYLETDNVGYLRETQTNRFTADVQEEPVTFNDKIKSFDLPAYSITNIKPIKAYGEVGVVLRPRRNIIGFNVIISDIDQFASEVVYVEIDNLASETTFIYDFNTDTFVVN